MKDDAARTWRTIVDEAVGGYRATDAHAFRFARAKLTHDAVFRHVLERGLIGPGAIVVDVGCGQGLLASLLRAAGRVAQRGRWPAIWGAAPERVRVTGIDLLPLDLARARQALGADASIVAADMRRFEFPPCDVVVFFDTLHYIDATEQDAVLAKVRTVLRPGGLLLMRVGDADAPLRFALGQWIDRFTMLLHGGGFGRIAGRSMQSWRAVLEPLGFRVEDRPMSGRPPFANRLIVARVPPAAGA